MTKKFFKIQLQLTNFLQRFYLFIESPYYYICVIIFITFCISLFALSRELSGGFRVMTAKSNSMIPAITMGDLTVVQDRNNWYEKGDIVTFYAQKFDGSEEIVTHRIYAVSGNVYITKGDNNVAIDETKLKPRFIIGKVITVVPFIGHVVVFLKSILGQLVCIIFPGVSFAVIEIIRIMTYLKIRYQDSLGEVNIHE